VKPKVFVVGATGIDRAGMQAYLDDIGTGWDVPEDATTGLLEFYGRLCYKSFEVGMNPNVTRIREDHDEYVTNIIRSKHGSIFESVLINFVARDVSRVFTHECVRHRVGTHFSQESMRYVRFSEDMPYRMPSCIVEDEWASAFWAEKWDLMQAWQRELADHFGVDDMRSFHKKKVLTSAFRDLIGQGVATQFGFSMNLRTLRHVLELRTADGVEEEFVVVAGMIMDEVRSRWPLVFRDFVELPVAGRPQPALVPEWSKI